VKWLEPDYPDRPRPGKTWQLLKGDIRVRGLVFQAFLSMIIFPIAFLCLLYVEGLPLIYTAAVFGMLLGGVVGLLVGAVFGLSYGVVIGVTCGVMGSVGGSAAFGLTQNISLGIEVGTAFGLAYGVTFGTSLSTALGMLTGGIRNAVSFLTRDVTLGVLIAAVFGAALTLAINASFGLMFAVSFYGGFIICFLRFPLYVFELLASIFGQKRAPHPAVKMDGIMLLPLPGLRKTLASTCDSDHRSGVNLCAEYLDYTLQFIPVVNAVNDRMSKKNEDCHSWCRMFLQFDRHDLIRFGTISLHNFIRNNFLKSLFIIPKAWCNRWYPVSPREDAPERAVCAGYYSIIKIFRSLPVPTIDDILNRLDKAIECFRLAVQVRHSYETINLYTVLRDCLACRNPENIAELAVKPPKPVLEIEKGTGNFGWLDMLPEPELRPELIEALRQLRMIAREVEAVVNLSSSEGRLSAAARANDALRGLDEFVEAKCFKPENMLLRLIIERWTGIITSAGGEVGRTVSVIKQIPNNYISGPALRNQRGRLFVGREDIYGEVLRLWSNEQIKQTVVFWGQRRIGKTSILLHMESSLGDEYLPVFLDMQTLATGKTLETFLYNLADSIAGQLNKKGLTLPEPKRRSYKEDPFVVFRKFIEVAENEVPPGKWLVLMLDEFERVEDKLNAGVYPPDLMFQFRNVMQHHPRIALVMAGSHHLDEMRREYWSPLLGITRMIKVGYLSAEAANKLITAPWEDFPLEYDAESVDRIIISTGGQPLLVQTVCSGILERVNERLWQSGAHRSFKVFPGDVEFIIKKTLAECEYFQAVFNDLPNQAQIFLKTLAALQKGPGTWTGIADIADDLKYKDIDTTAVVDILKRRDMIEEKDGNIRASIELVRRWLIK